MARGSRVSVDCCCEHVGLCPGREPSERHLAAMVAATDGRLLMEVMFERVAGIDVGKASLTVCVRTPGARRGRHSETWTFKTTTGSLAVMRDWLVEYRVTIAAMESTSTYWKAPFYCLEDVMQVWPVSYTHLRAHETVL